MLLTIRDVPEDLVRQAKIATGKGTGSQAFIAGIEQMLQLRDRVDEQREEISRLRDIVARQQQVLDQARDSAALLVEACGQGDMFFARSENPLHPNYRR
ncbi:MULTISPECIES: hypothetical protein [unclassified Pseudomonas]|uniref:hypothetical protein n=1 Tax=unclassified Pseudomonas TaxID=196821 RepID=UPI0024490024|nr:MULTISPECIES: hypothetical protein [unclassified Pseudomonas]MDG9926355.1 hypothetical protein [Pseudomonas sp. GD04045]MDH0037604.1 hypothetical protein [Pseudomonas sp. GD04019]